MLTRIRTTLHAKDRFKRMVHFLIAAVLFSLPETVRKMIFRGNKHYCPLCDTRLRTFLQLHRHYHLFCPVCRSLQRHRLVWLFLQQKTNWKNGLPKRMLHIAPEPALSNKFRQAPGLEYLSGDLHDSKAMVKLDLCNLQYPDNTFDIVFCSHVLEHVEDDQKAMREISRVLKQEGWALILVPITADTTYEDPSITLPIEREKVFGQLDHVRRYGPDVQERLGHNGFHVHVTKATDLVSAAQAQYMGLNRDELIFFCQKAELANIYAEAKTV